MPNPFEEASATFVVLTNEDGQHSLWPQSIAIPDGWEMAFGPDARQACLAYVEEYWTDMRPKSLVKTMAEDVR